MTPTQMTNKEVFQKVAPDTIKNIIWFGVTVLIIIFIVGKISWWLGVIIGSIYALITIADIIRVGFVSLLTPISLIGAIVQKLRGQYYEEGMSYMLAAWIFQLMETLVTAFYLYILYRAFFGK
jgi:hypothetical protein